MAAVTAAGIARTAVPLLVRDLVLARTVTNVPGPEFMGPTGGVVGVRVRQPRSANTDAPGSSLTPAALDEVQETITLGHVYDLHNIADDERSLDLEDFVFQVTEPQVKAVAEGVEDKLTTVMNGLATDSEFALTATEADTVATILAARETLGEANAPMGNRYLAVSPSIATRLLSVDQFVRVDATGSDNALRDSILGRIYGFTVVESNGLTTDTAIAYHSSAFALGVRAPLAPMGAVESASINEQGIALRQVFQYNAGIAADQSLVSTFAGATAIYEDADESSPADSFRWVKIGVSSS